MHRYPSRRLFLAAMAAMAPAAEGPAVIPSEARPFRDPATEFDLIRLTDPTASNCYLPPPPLRAISSRQNFLLYCSDRGGSLQAWRMDLKKGESRLATRAAQLDAEAVSLMPDDRSLVYFDGDALVVHAGKLRTVYTVEAGWQHQPGFALSEDGNLAAFVEGRDGRYRIRIAGLRRNSSNTIFESSDKPVCLRFRPKRHTLLYKHRGELFLVSPDGRGSQRLQVEEGSAGAALWSADGRLLYYLLSPGNRQGTVQMREHQPDSGEDQLIGPTTQFLTFARNGDSSVFAGISGSKASPYLLLLLRSARRELTVAEHRASDASRATVLFSPNSQRLYYQTDREGRSAIYTIALERFVEKTDETARVLRWHAG